MTATDVEQIERLLALPCITIYVCKKLNRIPLGTMKAGEERWGMGGVGSKKGQDWAEFPRKNRKTL